MDTTEVVNTAIQTPPPGEVAPPSTEEPVSLADHAAQFDPKRPEPAPTDAEPAQLPSERPRHRARSQQASATDVPRIAELTKKLRDAERERDEWKTKAAAPMPAPVTESIRQHEPIATVEGKPTWKTFEEQIGTTFETWADAQDAYGDARDEWKQAQVLKSYAEQQTQHAQQQVLESYTTKAQTYAKSTPDFFDRMKAAAPILDHIPDLLFQSIVRHDNGPEIAYYLVTHPVELDTMVLLADGKSVNESSVATLQRRLSYYRQPAASIASAATVPQHTPAPRPPNAMRTAPMKTGDDLPGDGHSLAEHARAFGKRR